MDVLVGLNLENRPPRKPPVTQNDWLSRCCTHSIHCAAIAFMGSQKGEERERGERGEAIIALFALSRVKTTVLLENIEKKEENMERRIPTAL